MIYPRSFYANPNSPFLVGFVRVWALILMFCGSYSLLTTVTEQIFSEAMAGIFVTLALSACAVWLLRPTIQHKLERKYMVTQTTGFLTTKGKWFVGIVLIVGVTFTVGVAIFVMLHR